MIVWHWGATKRSYWTAVILRRRSVGDTKYRGWTSGGTDPDDGAIWLDRRLFGPLAMERMTAARGTP